MPPRLIFLCDTLLTIFSSWLQSQLVKVALPGWPRIAVKSIFWASSVYGSLGAEQGMMLASSGSQATLDGGGLTPWLNSTIWGNHTVINMLDSCWLPTTTVWNFGLWADRSRIVQMRMGVTICRHCISAPPLSLFCQFEAQWHLTTWLVFRDRAFLGISTNWWQTIIYFWTCFCWNCNWLGGLKEYRVVRGRMCHCILSSSMLKNGRFRVVGILSLTPTAWCRIFYQK